MNISITSPYRYNNSINFNANAREMYIAQKSLLETVQKEYTNILETKHNPLVEKLNALKDELGKIANNIKLAQQNRTKSIAERKQEILAECVNEEKSVVKALEPLGVIERNEEVLKEQDDREKSERENKAFVLNYLKALTNKGFTKRFDDSGLNDVRVPGTKYYMTDGYLCKFENSSSYDKIRCILSAEELKSLGINIAPEYYYIGIDDSKKDFYIKGERNYIRATEERLEDD